MTATDEAARSASSLDGLSLRGRAAQLLMPRVYETDLDPLSPGGRRLRRWVAELGIGGVVVSRAPASAIAALLHELQSLAAVPLLVGADMEHGPGQILDGATRFPPAMALAATNDAHLAFELGRITATEARAAGVHVAFAPVADVNNNPSNPIINTRSYGEDPSTVSRMVDAHIRGLQQHGMVATVKHFPGHGDTVVDSHTSMPRIIVDRERADAVELPPFRTAIRAGVGGVMTAHVAFPALAGDDSPATLNAALLTGLLRDELGFDGLVFTDGLDMGAIVNAYGSRTAAVLALEAGADVLLQVPADDVESVLDAVVEAVERGGEAAAARLDDAARRVLRAKARLGLNPDCKANMAPPAELSMLIGAPSHRAVASAAALRAITLVRDDAGLVPLRHARVLTVIYTRTADDEAGSAFHEELAAALPGSTCARIDDGTVTDRAADMEALARAVDVVIFAAFVRVGAGSAGPALGADAVELATRLSALRPFVLTSFGSPWVLQQLPHVTTCLLAWAQWQPAQSAAARALLGVAAITGRLPVAIPPRHSAGDGLTIDATGRGP